MGECRGVFCHRRLSIGPSSGVPGNRRSSMGGIRAVFRKRRSSICKTRAALSKRRSSIRRYTPVLPERRSSFLKNSRVFVNRRSALRQNRPRRSIQIPTCRTIRDGNGLEGTPHSNPRIRRNSTESTRRRRGAPRRILPSSGASRKPKPGRSRGVRKGKFSSHYQSPTHTGSRRRNSDS